MIAAAAFPAAAEAPRADPGRLASFPRVPLVLGPTPLHPASRQSRPNCASRADARTRSRAAARLVAAAEGVFLDPVFGAKAMAALIAECRSGRARGTQMFLVSGGAPTLFAGSPDAAP